MWAISYNRYLLWEVVYVLEGNATAVVERAERHYFTVNIKLYHTDF
jgi:hypothetical protein